MSSLHLAQVGFFSPILKALRSSGVGIGPYLKESGLNSFSLGREENYVPQHAMQLLFGLIEKQEGIDDFLVNFSSCLQIAQLNKWGATLTKKCNLLSACQFATRYGHVVLTNERITLEINGRKSKVSLLSHDMPASDWSQMEYVNFAYMYSTFRLAAGIDAAPDEIHLQSHRAPDLDVMLPPGSNTCVLLKQPATALVFPTELLAAPMLGIPADPASNQVFPERPPGTADRVTSILDAWAGDHMPSLTLVCDALGMPPRSLQRRIAEEDKSFTEIIDQWRFMKSIALLSEQAMTIGEIGERLGYANTPNFERAFRRWTGSSPNRYRDSH